MIETITELLNQPGVQRAMKSDLVKNQLEQFNFFLSGFLLKLLTEWTKKLKQYFKWTNLILINVVVISYYAGKENANSLIDWIDVFDQFNIWFSKTILINIIYVIGRFLKFILTWTIRIATAILIIWLIYQFVCWGIEKFIKFWNFLNKDDSSLVSN